MSSHSQVAHAFAHQTGKNRKGYNLFYVGPRAYSHGTHFLLARIAEHKGRTVVFVNEEKRSVSTGAHRSEILSACSHMPVYMVECPETGATVADYDRHFMQAREAVGRAKRARLHGDHHLATAHRECTTAETLRATFDLDRAPVSLETLDAAIADQMTRVLEQQRREREARIERARVQFEEEAAARNAWLAGETGARWHGRAPDGSALLRVRDDILETSLGADVPLSHAIKAFRFVKLCRERGEAWHRNGRTVRVGHFTVDRIEPCGDFVAGCHRIAWAECERLARELGVFDAAPSADALVSSHA
jgi:hypothetical protein